MIGIVLIILLIFGIMPTVQIIQVVYFLFATMCFSYAIALITSTLSTIIRDVHMLLNASLRMLLYLSPILWNVDGSGLDTWIKFVMRVNPLYYLIEGYRASFLSQGWYMFDEIGYTVYFWLLTLLFFIVGSSVHVKFRKHFIDFL
jgi:teichoic acid transport system permease protein